MTTHVRRVIIEYKNIFVTLDDDNQHAMCARTMNERRASMIIDHARCVK